jgi:hypothetical protein
MIFLPYSSSYTFHCIFPTHIFSNPQAGLGWPACLPFLKKHSFICIRCREFHCYTSMYICIRLQIISSLQFFLSPSWSQTYSDNILREILMHSCYLDKQYCGSFWWPLIWIVLYYYIFWNGGISVRTWEGLQLSFWIF